MELMEWADKGACQNVEQTIFYPESHDKNAYNEARAVCAQCIVRLECLDYALRNKELDGCWGGTSPQQRRRMLRSGLYRNGLNLPPEAA